MKSFFYFPLLFLFSLGSLAQKGDSVSIAIDTVFVKAFEQNRSRIEVASPVQLIQSKDIQRFDNQGLTPILNQYPGIRMEERSPGSYRLSIRGSSLRSPFGVRNVKVYWNEIPLTDGNGITYFNFLDINTIESIEILKGPSGSMYGAGMGGVVLLNSNQAKASQSYRNSVNANFLVGGFGTLNSSINIQNATDKVNSTLSFAKSKFGGYREHSKMDREVFNWRSSFFLNDKYTLSLNTLYADLDYQTPLGLTQELKNENPRQARPGNRFVPGAIEQNAGIRQKMLVLGLSQEIRMSNNFKTVLSVFGNNTNLENPFITNYEFRKENTFGVRLLSNWSHQLFGLSSKLNFGIEAQKTSSTFDVFDNNGGEKGDVQSREEVTANQSIVFAQYDIDLIHDWFFTVGLSTNTQKYTYTDLLLGSNIGQQSSFDIPVIPRISLLKKVNYTSLYGAWSKGFSPPTVAELVTLYTNQIANITPLQAETANNWEIGIKQSSKSQKLYAEVSLYSQNLSNAIVRSFDENENQFFQNEGSLNQKGIEIYTSWQPIPQFKAFTSLNLIDYKFTEYVDLENDFTGNSIPSVANTTFTLGLDYKHKSGVFINSNINYVGDIPLDNANSVFAEAYTLVDARLGWTKDFQQITMKTFLGVNNLLNAEYGSGNDINAFGNRYFNPSPTRFFNGGLGVSYRF